MMIYSDALRLLLLLLHCCTHSGLSKRLRSKRHPLHYRTTTPMTTPAYTHFVTYNKSIDSVVPDTLFATSEKPHSFGYMISNADLCARHSNLFLLFLVLSAPEHVDRRMAIRDTWAASYNVPQYRTAVAFMVGNTSHITARQDINSENSFYFDIVQGDFHDSYANVSLKTMMAFQWARAYCSKAKFVLVASDYILVDVFKLVSYLNNRHWDETSHFCMCHLQPCCLPVLSNPIQQPENTLVKNYNGRYFPSHCHGAAFVVPSPVINQLHLTSLQTPISSPHFAYVGILAEKLRFNFTDTRSFYGGISSHDASVSSLLRSPSYLTNSLIVVGLKEEFGSSGAAKAMRKLWLEIVSQHKQRSDVDFNASDEHARIAHKREHSYMIVIACVALFVLLCVTGVCRQSCGKQNKLSLVNVDETPA